MKYEIGRVEAVSTRNNGLKLVSEDKWRDVVGKAADRLSELKSGDEVKIGLNDDGKVIYIQRQPQPQAKPATSELPAAIRVALLKLAVEIAKSNAENMNSTIDLSEIEELYRALQEVMA